MKTSAQVKKEFMADLKALLKKYNADESWVAEMSVSNHGIEVTLPAIYNEAGELMCERTTVVFGFVHGGE